jgi:hypothetical protein
MTRRLEDAMLPTDLPGFLERFGTDDEVPGLSVSGTLAGGVSLFGLPQ